MKRNRILSAVLVAVLLLSTIIAAFPLTAMASETPSVTDFYVKENDNKTLEQKKEIANKYKTAKYANVYEMFSSDYEEDYLDYFTYGDYSLYINRYTGVLYYKNNITNQILASNPANPGDSDSNIPAEVLSQVSLVYSLRSNPEADVQECSYKRITDGSLITIHYDENTFTVDYKLGEPEFIKKTPGAMLADDFETYLVAPLFKGLSDLLTKHLGEFDSSVNVSVSGYGKLGSYNAYLTDKEALTNYGGFRSTQIKLVTSAYESYASKILTGSKNKAKRTEISEYVSAINEIFANYNDYNVQVLYESFPYNDTDISETERAENKTNYDTYLNRWYESIPAMQTTGLNAFGIDKTTEQTELVTKHRLIGNVINKYLPELTEEKARELEARAGYVTALSTIPDFKCSVVYTLNEDGTLSVEVPSESIIYNSADFIVKSISPLQYFGYGDTVNDGYAFYPDGSGTVIEFADFRISESNNDRGNINVSSTVYGPDYCYANIIAKHREQVTMPVYGMVNTVNSNEYTNGELAQEYGDPLYEDIYVTDRDSFVSGFFAIIEEGSSIATIIAESEFGTHTYICSYASFAPRAYEKYDLSAAHSSLAGKTHYMVSNRAFEGSFETKYFMLTDPTLAEDHTISEYYPTTYIGMAACYKEYLINAGLISKVTTDATELPLYIETLGSMDVIQKILTFPVSVSTPLTTFADVQTMYNELSEAGVKNVNFKLTGFANGGMYYTYPARVWWENSLGGDSGYKSLVSSSNDKAGDQDPNTNFGIFPDFDFQFINNTAIFDGVDNNSHASKMLDNRYASKQIYNSITGKYDSLFAVLVRSDVLAELYEKFNKDYSKFGNKNLSVATLGSVLNSNMDNDKHNDNIIDREESLRDVAAVLDKMANTSGYSLMTDIGNIYSVKYVDHIVNATIDSSHLICTSYTVPFLGMVLHGYVNYAGTPLNYTGSVDYNILRSIENGASLYYILCMQNTNYLKEDEQLSKYYGVDYENWFDEIVEHYKKLNGAIGNLQNYDIVDHKALIAERIINSTDAIKNNTDLVREYVEAVDSSIAKIINAKLDEWAQDFDANLGKAIHVSVDKDALAADAIARFNFADLAELNSYGFTTLISGVVAKYDQQYPEASATDTVNLLASDVVYTSKYNYVTDSVANAEDYAATDFTCDNGNVVIVTYKEASSGKTVKFILNYNGFAVDVRLDSSIDGSITSGTEVRRISKCGFIKIEN
ncbi:MAG: hypothetical protein J6Q85_06350 [Clostridia bacterium]|nr:hypothetical protein [Clostridia bacterium]